MKARARLLLEQGLGSVAAMIVVLALCTTVGAQWLEKTIYLPDSFAVGDISCVAYNSSVNAMYVAGDIGYVLVIDASNDQRITRIRAGYGINAILYNPLENKVYTSNYDDSTVTVIDCATNAPIATLDVGAEPVDLAFNSVRNKIYCASTGSDDITVIDGAGDVVLTTVAVGAPDFIGLAYDSTDNKLFVASNSSDTTDVFVAIDGDGDTVIMQFPASGLLSAILWNPLENKIYHGHVESLTGYLIIRDASDYSVLAQVFTGRLPYFLCLNDTYSKIYSVNALGFSSDIAVIDGAGDSIMTWIEPDMNVAYLAYSSTLHKLYCLMDMNDSIIVVDGSTDSVVASMAGGGHPEHIAINEAESKAYCCSDSLLIIDCVGDTQLGSIEVGADPSWVGWNGSLGRLYCVHSVYAPPGGDVMVIDGTSHQITKRIPIGRNPGPSLFHEAGGKFYCGNRADSTISVIDCTADSVVATIPLPTGGSPYDLTIDSGGDKIYCSNGSGGAITVLCSHGDSVISTIGLPGACYDLLWYPPLEKLYCTDIISDSVFVIDGAADTLIGIVSGLERPRSPVWNSSDDRIYVAASFDDEVVVINPDADTIAYRIAVGDAPGELVWNSADNKLYCRNVLSSDITVIDCKGDSVIATIPVPRPSNLFWNSVSDKVYCSSYTFNVVTVIDGLTDTVLDTIGVGLGPGLMCSDPVENRVYVSNHSGSSISVIKDVVGVQEDTEPEHRAGRIYLHQNRPNPFMASTVLEYLVPIPGHVSLKVFDLSGRAVCTLQDGALKTGTHKTRWNGTDERGRRLPSGVYFLRLDFGGSHITRKAVILR